MGGIKDWPEAERPREKLLRLGAERLSDAELLAIFLRTGVPGCNAVQLADELLAEFSGLRGLLGASRQQFCKGRGLGDAKFVQLQAVLEMAKRHQFSSLTVGNVMNSPEVTRQFLTLQLRDRPAEVFVGLFLDAQHRLRAFEELFHGTIDGAAVYPRIVAQRALALNAAAVIVAHNHPSGIAEPSESDRLMTQRLQRALALIDVRLLDHFVIGEEVSSFSEMGIL